MSHLLLPHPVATLEARQQAAAAQVARLAEQAVMLEQQAMALLVEQAMREAPPSCRLRLSKEHWVVF